MASRKNPHKDREVQIRLEVERFESRLESARKRKNRFRRLSGHRLSQFEVVLPAPQVNRGPRWINLRLPKVLDLITNFEETADFVHEMCSIALGEGRPVRLLFDEAKQIKPTALLLLLAELHRCRLVKGASRVTGTYPEDERLERMMDATGFFGLLGVVSRVEKRTQVRNVEYIKFISEDKLDEHVPKTLRQSLLGEDISMNIIARKKLFRALSEAMINVGQHAYPAETRRRQRIQGRWWLNGTINKPRNELMIAFCDLGIGISRTLPKLYTWERIRGALALLPGINPNDGEMIQAAMTLGRSQTGEINRGKGLNDLRSFIDQSGTGELHIFSRHGAYRYSARGSEKVQNYRRPINGTLIKWTVPIDQVTNWIREGKPDEYEQDY